MRWYNVSIGRTNGVSTGVTYCRVYVNRMSAKAHLRVFQEIERIVKIDTGRTLRWRHIHGTSCDDYDGMILQWTGDQHAGQAKGAQKSNTNF